MSEESRPRRVFVIGPVDNLDAGDDVWYLGPSVAHEAFTGKEHEIKPSIRVRKKGTVTRFSATLKRGVATEGKGYYARTLPEDCIADLDAIDKAIEDAHRELKRLYDGRREFLAANAPRGERIRATDAVNYEQAKARGDA